MAKKQMVTGLFKDSRSAEAAYNDLLKKGYKDEEIHLVMSQTTLKAAQAGANAVDETESAVISTIAAISTLVPVPGIGLIMTGPIAASLAEDGTTQPEDIIPVLTGQGIPDDFAKSYESAINDGYILIGVEAHSPEDARLLSSGWEDIEAKHIYNPVVI